MSKERYQFGGITEQSKAALKRLRDAEKLQAAQRWRGAMYLGGYAIECQLKAKLMALYRVRTVVELEKRAGKTKSKLWDHNLVTLLALLREKSPAFPAEDIKFSRAFNLCSQWKSNWRYHPEDGNAIDCVDFMQALKTIKQTIEQNA